MRNRDSLEARVIEGCRGSVWLRRLAIKPVMIERINADARRRLRIGARGKLCQQCQSSQSTSGTLKEPPAAKFVSSHSGILISCRLLVQANCRSEKAPQVVRSH